MNDDNKNNLTKKRKASDGLATTDGAHDVNKSSNTNDGGGFLSSFPGQRNDDTSSGPPNNEQFIHQSLSQMNKIMMRVEEKLATVSNLESRCEQLEAKCSSLENMLESTSQSVKEHIDGKFDSLYLHLEQKCSSLENRLDTNVDAVHMKVDKSLKFHEYNEMLIKNQKWQYSAVVEETDLYFSDYSENETEYVARTAEQLKDVTTKMRRGEFPDNNLYETEGKGAYFETFATFSEAVNNELLPHWQEFAAALKQVTPAINVLPDNCESFFTFAFVQLNHDAMLLIKEALVGKPFQRLGFISNNNGGGVPAGMSVDAILDIVESNKHLRKLEIDDNRIGRNHIERLCSAVHNHALVELDLSGCFEPGIGDEMLTCLLTIDDLKLEKLDMSLNNITSAVSTLLADFLATNPRLKELNVVGNNLNDSDASLIANALRSNKTLRSLKLGRNSRITITGDESLRLVLYDESSLNAAADSNHTCTLALDCVYNSHDQGHINRGRKIYSILSTRNEMMSNVQHFSDIDVKILPIMLEAVQKYATNVYEPKVKPLSIVYEVMRKWDKALTCTVAGNFIET